MEVNSRVGEQNVAPEDVLTFPQGLPGFEPHTRYKLFREAEDSALLWMECLDDPEIQFTVADPALMKVQYQITLSDEECAALQLDSAEEIAVLVILYRAPGDGTEGVGSGPIQANFLGPLVINTRARLGMQKVLNQVDGFVTIQAN